MRTESASTGSSNENFFGSVTVTVHSDVPPPGCPSAGTAATQHIASSRRHDISRAAEVKWVAAATGSRRPARPHPASPSRGGGFRLRRGARVRHYARGTLPARVRPAGRAGGRRTRAASNGPGRVARAVPPCRAGRRLHGGAATVGRRCPASASRPFARSGAGLPCRAGPRLRRGALPSGGLMPWAVPLCRAGARSRRGRRPWATSGAPGAFPARIRPAGRTGRFIRQEEIPRVAGVRAGPGARRLPSSGFAHLARLGRAPMRWACPGRGPVGGAGAHRA